MRVIKLINSYLLCSGSADEDEADLREHQRARGRSQVHLEEQDPEQILAGHLGPLLGAAQHSLQ